MSEDGRVLGLRDQHGMVHVASARLDRFIADTWARRSGQEGAKKWTASAEEQAAGLGCQTGLCRWRKGPWRVALVSDERRLAEACGSADIVLSTVDAQGRCRGPRLRHRSPVDDEARTAALQSTVESTMSALPQASASRRSSLTMATRHGPLRHRKAPSGNRIPTPVPRCSPSICEHPVRCGAPRCRSRSGRCAPRRRGPRPADRAAQAPFRPRS